MIFRRENLERAFAKGGILPAQAQHGARPIQERIGVGELGFHIDPGVTVYLILNDGLIQAV